MHLYAGADRALLVSKKVTKGCLEAAVEAGSQHLTSFQAMHAAIMQKADSGNRLFIKEQHLWFLYCVAQSLQHASALIGGLAAILHGSGM